MRDGGRCYGEKTASSCIFATVACRGDRRRLPRPRALGLPSASCPNCRPPLTPCPRVTRLPSSSSSAAFGNRFADCCKQAGLRAVKCKDGKVRNYRIHGLRKAACLQLVEAGCTAPHGRQWPHHPVGGAKVPSSHLGAGHDQSQKRLRIHRHGTACDIARPQFDGRNADEGGASGSRSGDPRLGDCEHGLRHLAVIRSEIGRLRLAESANVHH